MNLRKLCPWRVLPVALVSLLLGWLAWLGHDSWQWLQQQQRNDSPPLQETAVTAPHAVDSAAIARMFGVEPQAASGLVPAVPLTLLASLVESRPELSRALIESPDGGRFYRIGESLPGGAILREIGVTQVRLQRYGEDQALSLASHATPLLIPLPSGHEVPTSTAARVGQNSLVQPSL
ncbi:hypothetical protein J4P02_29460 [Pseudomonas sp. NFXW11]|uniref:type II secretion system protein N n=1 Tax=Pseudomonas sp. NFXW11 TaxID=2819531 RepID=UPI003CF2AEBD